MNQQFMKIIRKWRKPIDWIDISLSWNVFTYPEWLQQQIEQKRNEIYESEKANGKKIRDSLMYRVDAMEIWEESCWLKIGTMNWSLQFTVKFCQDLFFTLDEEVFPSGIACWALIETTDGKFIFGIRNDNTAWRKWWEIAIVWWTLEPSEWIVTSYQWFYDHVCRELHEEIGVSVALIADTHIIWIQRMKNGWIWFIYYLQLSCNSEEVRKLFWQRTDDEMSDVCFVDRNEVVDFLYQYSYENNVLIKPIGLCIDYLQEIFIHTK